MIFRVHGEYSDGTPDNIIVEGETIDEVREKANVETGKRGWTNLWSEQLEGEAE